MLKSGKIQMKFKGNKEKIDIYIYTYENCYVYDKGLKASKYLQLQ